MTEYLTKVTAHLLKLLHHVPFLSGAGERSS